MSLLGDFAGNFLSIAGNNMQQQEDQDRAIRLQEEIERRRFARQQNMKAKTSLPEQRPVGAPYQDPQSGKWLQRTQQARQALLDENTGDVTQAAAWEDGQSVEVADPNALTPYQQAQIDQKELDRQNRLDVAGVRSSGKGGRGAGRPPSPVTVTNPDGSKTQYDPVSGDVLHDFPAKRGRTAGKDATERKAIKETLDSIAGAQSVIEVKNALRAHGINPDSQEVLNLQPDNNGEFLPALKAYAADKIGAKVKEPEASDTKSQSPDRIIAAAKAAIAEGRDERAVRKKTAQLLGIDEKDVQL